MSVQCIRHRVKSVSQKARRGCLCTVSVSVSVLGAHHACTAPSFTYCRVSKHLRCSMCAACASQHQLFAVYMCREGVLELPGRLARSVMLQRGHRRPPNIDLLQRGHTRAARPDWLMISCIPPAHLSALTGKLVDCCRKEQQEPLKTFQLALS